jgi:hypothetical protein
MIRGLVACLISVQLGLSPLRAADEPIKITILEGEGAANNIRTRAAHDLVVTVTQADGRPVAGAAVVFTAPSQGAGGTFLDGALSTTSVTDARGQAVAKNFRPNQTAGKFEIRVSASWNGSTARTVITQFNMDVPAPAADGKRSGHGKLLLILAAIGGAAAGGIVAATQGGGSANPGTPATGPVPIGITPGAGSVGPPK